MTVIKEYKAELDLVVKKDKEFSVLEVRFFPKQDGIRVTHRSVNKELYLEVEDEGDGTYRVDYSYSPNGEGISHIGCRKFHDIHQLIKGELLNN